jgi:protein-S-isoprenylcysteine O-methyltransferase Ste14
VLGDEYRDYRRQVPGLLPWPRPHTTAAAPQS